ncbi:molybdenum cofactor carrier [Rhodovulum sp. 12E13]|uniref:putative molybdenum carrier protein n=1 Tax=Rhodovulum sp. 12E13 TaxID=2203891 RepID=UPI000E183A3F|nr:putative molybdenum carrier protein [Rhodovulum sp. 12E13]RDC70987.1 molybdenum cofactor carrier [Rhodovulum sp. 12E13]
MAFRPRRIVSGAQTGVDLAALDVALDLGFETGGWVPKGRRNEAGPIPEYYAGLVEAESAAPAVRTDLNVRDSDATLILARDAVESPGTALTERRARAHGRPCLRLTLDSGAEAAAEAIRRWLEDLRPPVLNVAGPRESSAPGIGDEARAALWAALGDDPA